MNPLADRLAWSGNSGGFINTVINLGPNLRWPMIKLRFRMGTDEAGAAPGVRIDTFVIVGSSNCPNPALVPRCAQPLHRATRGTKQ